MRRRVYPSTPEIRDLWHHGRGGPIFGPRPDSIPRRTLVLGALATLAAGCGRSHPAPVATPPQATPTRRDTEASFGVIEQRIGGRLGVYALDTETGRELAHRADERFALCSTFKWVLAACVLARADRSEVSLGERIAFGAEDLLEYAPACRAHVNEGSMTIAALAEAIVTVSDNTAANLLLAKLGGPAAVNEFSRSHGDRVTRLDRSEPELNANAPGDVRDTTTPRAMAALMHRILIAEAIAPASRERLVGWMRASVTGKERLRAGLPREWVVGDKTGTGNRGACNDVAVAWPREHAPVLIAVYLSDGQSGLPALQAAHAEVARLIATDFAG
jgi:beta-lactamase class A